MRNLIAAALALLALVSPVHADQLLGQGRIDSSNRVVLPGGPTLGRYQGNKYIATPDTLSLPQNDNGSTGDVSGMSVKPNPNGGADTLGKFKSTLDPFTQGLKGQIPYKKSGTAGDIAWVNQCLNIEAFGGVADGSSDNAPALDAALAALPAKGGCIYSPAGRRLFSRAVSYTYGSANQSITFTGDGQNNSEWVWPTTDGLIVTLKDATTTFHMRDMAVTTGSAAKRTGVKLTVPGTNANGALGEYSDFERVAFRGSDGYAQAFGWATALILDNVSNVNVDGSSFIGTSASLGYGIRVSGRTVGAEAVVFNFAKSSWVHLAVGVEYGSNVQGVTISQANFTGVTRGVSVPSTATGVLSQLSIVASQFASNPNAGGASIDVQAAVNPVTIADNLFLSNGPGTQINFGVHSFTSISGNHLYSPSPNNNIALNFAGGQSPSSISGNVIFGFATALTVPISTANASVTNNTMTGNTATIVYASNSNNKNQFIGNTGFQPAPPVTQTVNQSPWVYDSPGLPVTVCAYSGTITQVVIDGVLVAQGPGCFPISANENVSISYSAKPVITVGMR